MPSWIGSMAHLAVCSRSGQWTANDTSLLVGGLQKQLRCLQGQFWETVGPRTILKAPGFLLPTSFCHLFPKWTALISPFSYGNDNMKWTQKRARSQATVCNSMLKSLCLKMKPISSQEMADLKLVNYSPSHWEVYISKCTISPHASIEAQVGFLDSTLHRDICGKARYWQMKPNLQFLRSVV